MGGPREGETERRAADLAVARRDGAALRLDEAAAYREPQPGARALPIGRLMGSLLYEVRPLDPVSLCGAALMLVVAASVASYLPARRALRVDPIVTLRAE